ncbi:hypothetical protein [Saccharothrix sp. HUAS TT1]|uniref:hypothetical protein n=1 Tax=unclassified Saccharothrix TaxID=2593673 RepID=UPI00345C3CCC
MTHGPAPLTGGLDLAPDPSFAGLDDLLGGRAADVVVVPAVPDVGESTTRPVTDWLRRQSEGGSLLLSVRNGAGVSPRPGCSTGGGPPRTGCASTPSRSGTRPSTGFAARGTWTTAT